MNAKELSHADWLYIIDRIEEGWICGEIRSIQGNEEIYGWWSLINDGIVVEILN